MKRKALSALLDGNKLCARGKSAFQNEAAGGEGGLGGWRWGVTENHFSKAEPPEPSECKSWLPGSGVQAEPGQRAQPVCTHTRDGRTVGGA